MIVTDTNVIAYLFIPGPFTQAAEKVLMKDPAWGAPLLWQSEFLSVVTGCLRDKVITEEYAFQILDKARHLMQRHEYRVPMEKVIECAKESSCSAYDCEYAALAKDLKVPLVTTDKAILKAFPSISVDLKTFTA